MRYKFFLISFLIDQKYTFRLPFSILVGGQRLMISPRALSVVVGPMTGEFPRGIELTT